MVLGWGIIGCGDVAEKKGGPALYGVPGSELIAVMRRDVAKAEDFARRHGAKRWYGTAEELLADPEVNAVYVATPVDTHHHYTLLAAAASKHVLCEKPMAMNVAECRDMIAACDASGVKLAIAYYRRTYPVVQKMRQLLQEDAIGEPMLARINLTSYYNPADPLAPKEWRADAAIAGGGVMFDVGSHRLDVLVYLLGDVARVAGFSGTLHAGYAVEDAVALALELASGVQAVANFNWNVGSSTDEFEIYGTAGKMLARPLEGGHLELYQGQTLVSAFDLPRPAITHWELVENLVAAMDHGALLVCSGEDGLKTSQIMEAAYRAAAGQCTIAVPASAGRLAQRKVVAKRHSSAPVATVRTISISHVLSGKTHRYTLSRLPLEQWHHVTEIGSRRPPCNTGQAQSPRAMTE